MIKSHNLPNPQKILLRLSLSPTSPASSLFCFKRNILERLKNTSSVKTYLVENVAAFANLQRTSQHQGTAFTLPFTFLNLSFRTQHNTQVVLREGFTKKKLLFFWILSKLPPPNLDNLYNFFLNAKNDDLGYIQNDSLSKILLK